MGWRICPICHKQFAGYNKTCSRACGNILHSRTLTGRPGNQWSDAARAAAADRAKQTGNLSGGTAAAMTLPEGQRGPQNRECKVWVLIDPAGHEHMAVGLLPWARENWMLFEPYGSDPEKAATRICAGFRAIASSMRGADSRTRTGRAATTYKGWRLGDLPTDKK